MSEPSARGDAGPKDALAAEETGPAVTDEAPAPEETEPAVSDDAPPRRAPLPGPVVSGAEMDRGPGLQFVVHPADE